MASISVYDGHLRLRDGIGWYRRERSYNRATTHLSRLVVSADSGSLSLVTLRWCHAVGITVVVLDPHEPDVLLAPAVTGVDDSRSRRAPALAVGTETGLGMRPREANRRPARHRRADQPVQHDWADQVVRTVICRLRVA